MSRASKAIRAVSSSHARRFWEVSVVPRAARHGGWLARRRWGWDDGSLAADHLYLVPHGHRGAVATDRSRRARVLNAAARATRPSQEGPDAGMLTRDAALEVVLSATSPLCYGGARPHEPTRGELPVAKRTHNKRVNLSVRPVTHLAGEAPPRIFPKGGGQGACPSRPAGYAQRWQDSRSNGF